MKNLTEICRYIESYGPSLINLSKQFGISAAHLQKSFKASVGLSPKKYHQAYLFKKIKISNSRSITSAIYDAGYTNTNRFYDAKRGGLRVRNNEIILYAYTECSFGRILVAQSSVGICAILFGDAALEQLKKKFPNAVEAPTCIDNTLDYVVGFIDQQKCNFDLPLDIRGTVFQEKVWRTLQTIPKGQQLTYKEVAVLIGDDKAYRAVANACGANMLAVAVPCHRVVGQTNMAGYRWGVELKEALLKSDY